MPPIGERKAGVASRSPWPEKVMSVTLPGQTLREHDDTIMIVVLPEPGQKNAMNLALAQPWTEH